MRKNPTKTELRAAGWDGHARFVLVHYLDFKLKVVGQDNSYRELRRCRGECMTIPRNGLEIFRVSKLED